MMGSVNRLMNGLFDLLMWPCRGTSPWPGLLVSSFVAAAMFVVLFRSSSNPRAIVRARNQLIARTLELLLFQHDLRVNLTSCGRILSANFAYLFQFLLPMAVGLIPLVLLFAQLEAWFERRPVGINEKAVLTVKLGTSLPVETASVEIRHSSEIRVDPHPVRIPSRNELGWRMTALTAGQGWVEVAVNDAKERMSLVTGNRLARITPYRAVGGVTNELFTVGEPPLASSSPIQRIEISYPHRTIALGLRDVSWIAVVIVITMLFSLILAHLLGVRIV